MAATSIKFPSINTNKLTIVLTYALLEWTLIIFLLLNSIFFYFITKFAQFFNLKPPCFWCTHIHQFFETQNQDSAKNTRLLCEQHSKEVSQLGFCLKHKKLATFYDMCEDCSFGFDNCLVNSSVEKVGFGQRDEGFDDLWFNCACCGVEFKRKRLDDLGYFLGFGKNGDLIGDLIGSDLGIGEFGGEFVGKQLIEVEIESVKEDLIRFEKRGEHEDLEFCLDYSGNQLVPIESIDRDIEKLQDDVDEDQEFGEFQKAEVMSELKNETVTEELVNATDESSKFGHFLLHVATKADESSNFAGLDSMEFEETANSLVFHANSSGCPDEKPAISEPIQTPSDIGEEPGTEGSDSDHEEAEVSIGTEIPVLDSCDEIKAQDNFNLYSLSHEEPSSSSHDLDFNLECGLQEAREDEETEELKNLNQEADDTLLVIERKDSMADESFDGSELDGGDPIDTTEKLKSALRAERKALQALYTELEEERSASAVAASETMAMINRLQEEKAAMQMEALHYQRMMEEQSEYDQEALQLLNDLMVKKDKELESYRKKVLDYEAKERMRFSTSSVKSGTFSASCSHSEEGDGMWVDLNHEAKEEGVVNGNQESQNQNSHVDTAMALDTSFVDFEDERLSILEQLKVLEEKLFTLSDEEDRHFEDYFEENGKHLNGSYGYDGQEVNGITRYQDRRPIGSTGKRLLPLFDALETESDDGVIASNGNGNGFHPDKMENTAITRFELQKKRIDIEEEVDQLYVRLQALEADREFLKHCIGSLKKGDQGMELLQEILQHLRDLKNVDLREKSFTDGTVV